MGKDFKLNLQVPKGKEEKITKTVEINKHLLERFEIAFQSYKDQGGTFRQFIESCMQSMIDSSGPKESGAGKVRKIS